MFDMPHARKCNVLYSIIKRLPYVIIALHFAMLRLWGCVVIGLGTRPISDMFSHC